MLDNEHLYARTVEIAPPDCACGYQPLEIAQVAIPATVGQTPEETDTELQALNLVVNDDLQFDCDAVVAAGLVISTIPPVTTMVNVGSVVTLIVSTGPCP